MLDTADRFVNCKSAKYYLRNSEVDIAVETAALFTRVRSIHCVCMYTHSENVCDCYRLSFHVI